MAQKAGDDRGGDDSDPLPGRPAPAKKAAEKLIGRGPNGPETPSTVGLSYEHLRIPSGERSLDTYIVRADPACQVSPSPFLHSGCECLFFWARVGGIPLEDPQDIHRHRS
jgi:hypothetical protein